MPKKVGRPSKADIAARQAWAAREAAKAEAAAAGKAAAAGTAAAAGKAAAEPRAMPVPTADLDPPTQHSTTTTPAAASQTAARSVAPKPAANKLNVATAVAEMTGNASKLPPPASKSRLAVGNTQKPGTAVAPSSADLVEDKQDSQQLHRHATRPVDHDVDDEDDEDNYTPDDALAAVMSSKPGAGKMLKRLKKQSPGARSGKEQAAQHSLEDDDAALAQAPAVDAMPSQGSGLSHEQSVSADAPRHVDIVVDAVGLVDAGCARARPWLKHVQKAAEEAQAAAEAAAKQILVNTISAAQPRSAAAAAKHPTAVAINQDSVGQVGSGGSEQAAVAEQSSQKEFHSRARSKEGRLSATDAQQPQQQDQHSQIQRQHEPRGSRTSPHSPPPLPTVELKHADSRTGTSQPRVGTSQPSNNPTVGDANNTRNRHTQHRQADDTYMEAHASPRDEAGSGDSSDNATVQHGVGHTGESSEALPASMKSSKPAAQLQHQQMHQLPTSSFSEQAIHSAAGNTKPGAALRALL